jgi:hypothetical protein
MASAKKQKAKEIVASFMGDEERNKNLLQSKKTLQYSPNIEFFVNNSTEYLIAIVLMRPEDSKNNPVYRITDLELLDILESFAKTTGGIVTYYKLPK